MSENPLNRLSWLRKSHTFINAVVSSPSTRWILFKNGEPLLISDHGTRKLALAYLTTDDVLPLLGSPPFFGQGECEGQIAGSDESLAAARHLGIPIVFLGLNSTTLLRLLEWRSLPLILNVCRLRSQASTGRRILLWM